MEENLKKPEWIRARFSGGETWERVSSVLESRGLHTVCDEARCPNKGECWGSGTATFMILGDTCTRNCRFCAVNSARQGRPVREDEGEALALAAEELGLRYVVLTSVDRDDLPDRGAGHFARCTAALRRRIPAVQVEALVPDYGPEELAALAVSPEALPGVLAHNVETVRSLQHIRDSRASFDRSLDTLRAARALGAVTKSSILLGLGEEPGEVLAAMDELRAAGVSILVLGQYLRPSPRQLPVAAYIHPDQFAAYAEAGRERGFSQVVAAPLARTSYHAARAAAWAVPFRRIEGRGKPAGSKLIRISAELEGPLIRTISIRGDFLASPEEGFDRAEARLCGTAAAELGPAFDRLLREEGVDAQGISGAALAEVFQAALDVVPEAAPPAEPCPGRP